MSEHIHKRHTKTLLLYHLVFPVKYRRRLISVSVSDTIKETCIGIGDRFEIDFIEIGTDEDQVHFLVQRIPPISVDKIVRTVKSLVARIVLSKHPELKRELWGGSFWTSGYYANKVGQYGNEEIIKRYVGKQGNKYNQIHSGQLNLF